MIDIDNTIEGVEQLYRSITGTAPLNGAPTDVIPPERDPVQYIEAQMDRLLSALGPPQAPRTASPPMTLWETEQAYVAVLDLPGVAREGVKVSLAAGGLIVNALRANPVSERAPAARVLHQDQPIAAYARHIAFPADAALEQVEAKMQDGSLTLRVPRAAAQGRNIEVH